MSSSAQTANKSHTKALDSAFAAESDAVLVRDAGVPFLPSAVNLDPITEWISLMEVVQMLCPVWPVRDAPMLGKKWKL
jgi:hypothetical protein